MQAKLNGMDVDAVVLVDTDGVPYAAGGGGGGGDTSNITTVGNAVPTKAAYIAVKNGANTGALNLGAQADAAALAVSLSTENKALIGALTETAPASDTASSGLNGRLQRLAQNITTMIAATLNVAGTRIGGNSASGATHLAVGGTDGTNHRMVSTDTGGKVNVNAQPAGNVSTAESSVSLTANTSATVAASNTSRLFLTIDNPNATDIWINTQGAAVATAGSSMRIFGNTQVTFSVQEIGTNAVTAISVPAVSIRYRETSKS